MNRPTDKDYIKHLKKGIGAKCLVCGEEFMGTWTDYNGEAKCYRCGMPYQILGSHLKEEFLTEHGMKNEDVAKKYCPDFHIIPMMKDYWNETHNRIPLGTYLGHSPIPESEYIAFKNWLSQNKEKYQEAYAEDFRWEAL